jgi:formylglycine-generating enzyme required for sulfatase activity
MLVLNACGKKSEKAASEAAPEPAPPAIVPGEMALIPAGEFIFGSNDKNSIAYPEQKINLPAYWIDKYEVTNKEFQDFAANAGYTGEGAKEGRDWRYFVSIETILNPVVYITWKDAAAYCKYAGKRLPTEEEWEKAARGTDGRIYPWGNEFVAGKSNTSEAGTGAKTVAIGQYDDVSPFGVHDMFGNVQEWTGSWYTTYKGNPKQDPKSGKTLRVVRGLSAVYKGKMGHLYDRSAWPPEALFNFGCRCAKDATPEDVAKAAKAK